MKAKLNKKTSLIGAIAMLIIGGLALLGGGGSGNFLLSPGSGGGGGSILTPQFLTRSGGSSVQFSDTGDSFGIGVHSGYTPASRLEIQDNLTGSSVSDVILSINNASSTTADAYIDFQSASTSAWYLGVDDSANKLRLTPAGAFNATSSGWTMFRSGNASLGATSTTANATTTLFIGNNTASIGSAIILEDNDGAGCTQITVLNGSVLGATVTCP